MDEKYLATIVSSLITELIKESKGLFGKASAEGKQFLKSGIKKYLEQQKKKYSYLKTLLKGNTPVYLYDIYYPLKLKCADEIINTSNISDVFSKNNYLTIIGDAGSGKSTLVKHLFLNSIYTKYAIPILIELRYLNDYEGNLESYIIDAITQSHIAESGSILKRLLQSGKFVFFLDGYDELSSKIKQSTIKSINSFIDQFGDNKYILTTRPYSEIEHHPTFHNNYVKSLSLKEGEIEGFISKQLENEKELSVKISLSIKTNKSEHIRSFLKNPLLLSLYILTFQSNSTIPNKKYLFYRRVINALFSEHDSKTKLGFVREKVSGLNQEEFEDLLRAYCYLSYFENRFNWDPDYISQKFNQIKVKKKLKFTNNKVIKDLKSAIALWVEDNSIYSFAHRSLQEYYAAYFVKNLNAEENKRIYDRIIDRMSKYRSITEIENFLSLLEEMDTLSFNRYYLLPLLKELRKEICNDTDSSLVNSFIKLLATGVNLPSAKPQHSPLHQEIIELNNEKVFKSIYINLPFAQELHSILTKTTCHKDIHKVCKNDINIKEFKVSSASKKKTEKINYISFKESVPKSFLNLCHDEVLKVSRRFDKYLDNGIAKTTKYIEDSLSIDRDLVDLV